MRHFLLTAALAVAPFIATAQTPDPVIAKIVDSHILPRFQALADTTAQLAVTARGDCAPESTPLRAAYSDAFDAWIGASHLRFGPTEVDDRAFALAFWPDSRGATPRTLNTLIAQEDPVAATPEAYAQVSIAARGFYALEFLLYDAGLSGAGDGQYRCMLVQTMTADMATTSAAILRDWQTDYAARILAPDAAGPYRSEQEVLQEMLKALTAGLQFTSETRLGRPLGTFERPRPTRAEAWRSGRSARHVGVSLAALGDLAHNLASGDPDLVQRIEHSFARTQARLADLNDPVFAGVSEPQSRLRLEVIQQSVDATRDIVRAELGPTLGVSAGFNALDGD